MAEMVTSTPADHTLLHKQNKRLISLIALIAQLIFLIIQFVCVVFARRRPIAAER